MFARRWLLSIVALCLLVAPGTTPAAPPTSWEPAKTWLFAVGILKWKHPDLWPPFPDAEKNRCDQQFVDFFKNSGVPDRQVVYLKDQQATLRNTRKRFADFITQPGEDDLLIFYFAGHGSWDWDTNRYYLVNYDGHKDDSSDLWSVKSICHNLGEHFGGGRILFLVDCCHSGGLAAEVRKCDWDFPTACLASTFAHNESTGSWTFTDTVLKALRGDPQLDTDGDGVIRLNELAGFVERKMAFYHGQRPVFVTRQGFSPGTVLARTKGKRDPGLNQHVEVFSPDDGAWYGAEIIRMTRKGPEVAYVDYDETEVIADAKRLRPYKPLVLPRGTRIQVRWGDGEKYSAVVKDAWYGLHYVHYVDFDDTYDDWVSMDQIIRQK